MRLLPGSGAPWTCQQVSEQPGTVIGPYKLLQPIGEGGMGTVYMAEQTQPVRRTVALKLIKAGMDSRQVLARFGAERQALALMDHPNIAKVFDAGTTDTGRPYFVMELVKGIPITRFCDERRLTPRERLELVIPVCQAVQHAHQKGIIHRDLKPSNVLVALYDGKPVPKVIDFGVAKATGPRLTDQTLYTEFGAVVGTLEYMSPEQAELNQLDIDTRSDIYSLGVLLYELLTGSTPLDRKRLKQAAILEMLRVIREEESPRPSMRLSTTEELPSIAACRNIEPRKLSGLVRGELDWIVMKALEKDRNRRYETANGLAADLRRYLDDEPVQACPPSAWYRFGKFARRNRGALAIASTVLLAVLWPWLAHRRQPNGEAGEGAEGSGPGTCPSGKAHGGGPEPGHRARRASQGVSQRQRWPTRNRCRGPVPAGEKDLLPRRSRSTSEFDRQEQEEPASQRSKAGLTATWRFSGGAGELTWRRLTSGQWPVYARLAAEVLRGGMPHDRSAATSTRAPCTSARPRRGPRRPIKARLRSGTAGRRCPGGAAVSQTWPYERHLACHRRMGRLARQRSLPVSLDHQEEQLLPARPTPPGWFWPAFTWGGRRY